LPACGPGAGHAFTDPEATENGRKFNRPLAHDPGADRQAKAEAAKFFGAVSENPRSRREGAPAASAAGVGQAARVPSREFA
jgi:hypothetical protein